MEQTADYAEIELQLFIDDDFKHIHDFSVDMDYPDSDEDEMNTVYISIETDTEITAYMEVYIFYGDRIDDLTIFADGVSGDARETMCALFENGLLVPYDPEKDTIEEMFDSLSSVIAHINYMAVRDDYRKQGMGSWLFKNLPRILSRNYGIKPRIISTTICPQVIAWDKPRPCFSPPDENIPADEAMHSLMEKLLVQNGYQQLGDTEHHYMKPSSLSNNGQFKD